jgi:hypothetical protein
MFPPRRPPLVLAVVLLSVTGCAPSSEGPGPTTTPTPAGPGPSATPGGTASASPTPGAAASASPSPGPGAALPDDLRTRPTVVAAIADTASRERVPPEQVVLATWSPVTWTDGSLGCPKKGMSYTQALVEGELLILRVGGELFQYHARSNGPFSFCASPSAGYRVGG